jgi:hypothetical protein
MAPVWNPIATPATYSASAKAMHWFLGAAVIVLLALGPVMKRLVPEGALRDNLIPPRGAGRACPDRHGRATHPAPGLRRAGPRRVHAAYRAARLALGAIRAIHPSFRHDCARLGGDQRLRRSGQHLRLFDFPTIIGKDQALSDRLITWHLICGILIGAIVALHIAGALYHGASKAIASYSACCRGIEPSLSYAAWT